MSNKVITKKSDSPAIELAQVSAEEQRREEAINFAIEHLAEANLRPTAGAWAGRDDLINTIITERVMLRQEAEAIVNAAVVQLLSPQADVPRHVERRKLMFRLEGYRQLLFKYLTNGETEDKFMILPDVDPMTQKQKLNEGGKPMYRHVPVETKVKKGLNQGIMTLILGLEDRLAKLFSLDTVEKQGSDVTAEIFKQFERDASGNVTESNGLVLKQTRSLDELAAQSQQVQALLTKASGERAKQVASKVVDAEGSNDTAGKVGELFDRAPAADAPERLDDPHRRDAEHGRDVGGDHPGG